MINFYYLINFLECGHFCVNYILKKDKIKPNCTYNKSMMSLRLIKDVLCEYYENVIWYKNVNIDEINSSCLSLIKIRNKYYHYIVIERVKQDFVYYYDPLFLFVRKKRKSKFNKKWSHMVCICA